MANKRISIIQPGFIPWLGFFELMYKVDLFVFLDDVQYTVRDWRNRNRIRTYSGWQWLTVPVFHKHNQYQQQLIKDIQINNTIYWRKKHLNTLSINYHKAKFFDIYYKDLERMYSQNWTNLCELNLALIGYLTKRLGITTPCVRSSALNIKSAKSERIVEICQSLNANELYDSKAAANFLELSLFAKRGIKVEFQNYNHPIYPQVYKPFIPYMSIVDLLFNCGSESLRIINNEKK